MTDAPFTETKQTNDFSLKIDAITFCLYDSKIFHTFIKNKKIP